MPLEGVSLNPAVFNAIETVMPLSFERKARDDADGSFSDLLAQAMGTVAQAREVKSELVEQMVSGQDVDTHTVMIAQAKEDVLTRLTSTTVTKIASAYQTLMNMQI